MIVSKGLDVKKHSKTNAVIKATDKANSAFQTPNTQKDLFINNSNIAFKGNDDKQQNGLMKKLRTYALVALASIGASNISGSSTNNSSPIQTEQTSQFNQKDEKWSENVRVFASISQMFSTYGGTTKKDHSDMISAYTDALSQTITSPSVTSLEQSNDVLRYIGYMKGNKDLDLGGGTVVTIPDQVLNSVQSPNIVEGWQKSDNGTKKRYALLMGGIDFEKPWRTNNIDAMKKALTSKDGFNVPENNIVVLNGITADEMKKGLEAFKEKVNKEEDKDNLEVMIYYNGHGMEPADLMLPEGLAHGFLGVGVGENSFKQWINPIAKENKKSEIVVIVDTCFAGAFTVKNDKPSNDDKTV